MKGHKGNLIPIAMAVWVGILGSFALWQEMDSRREERRLALTTANAFYQQILVSRQWNAAHGGVYVVSTEVPPDPYLPENLRQLTTDSGLRLTRINPAYMTKQMAELADRKGRGPHFHITSLDPINPDNKATNWETEWLLSFEQGAREQGAFYKEDGMSWFRYMAPLTIEPECLKCHKQSGLIEGGILGGISVSLPYTTRGHIYPLAGYGSVAVIGLVFIYAGGSLYERKRLQFDATFNNTLPTCLTDKNHTILMANESYWAEFGPLPENKKSIKCHEHRPGKSCHTEQCPLTRILGGANKWTCEPSKEKEGKIRHFIVTAKPLFDTKGKVAGIVESFQDITDRKRLEEEKEQLISELKKSLEQVKLLSGLIPICSSCKKVRDDLGFWTQVEAYVSKHSEAQFSHGICPDCIKKLYPGLSDKILKAAGARPPAEAKPDKKAGDT